MDNIVWCMLINVVIAIATIVGTQISLRRLTRTDG